MENVYEWFVYSSMKANPDKFQFTILENTGSHTLKIGDNHKISLICYTTWYFTIDSKVNFKEHINNFVKKAYYKLYKKTTKVSNIRKSQNLSYDRKSICLLPINLDILLKNRYAKS